MVFYYFDAGLIPSMAHKLNYIYDLSYANLQDCVLLATSPKNQRTFMDMNSVTVIILDLSVIILIWI